jgi:hypothetical protein
MGLTSEQAKVIAARPRINPVEEQQMISLFADGKKPAEVALQFPAFAPGTIANLQTRKKEQIAELRRKRMVQFEDLTIVRKQARLDDLQDLRNIAWEQLRLLLETGCVIDGRTGEVRRVPVDPRLFKAAADTTIKVLRTVDETTGQLPQRVDGLDSRYTAPVLGLNGNGGIDYPAIAQRKAEREAEAPEREAAKREREAESNAFMKSITARIEEAKQVALEQAHERVLARHPEWAEDDTEDDEADQEAKVQELFRVTPPLPEPAPEPVEDAVEEPELEPEVEPEAEEPADYQVALERLIAGGASVAR